MIIVLTSERALKEEAKKINQLFDAGLKTLHLRKPSFGIEAYKKLIEQIKTEYHTKIMLHQFHELCEVFHLKGVHLREEDRIQLGDKLTTYTNVYREKGYTISSSFHSKEAITNCSVAFDYIFLSPVFESISKKGYNGKGFDVTDRDEFIIGMGGINEKTLIKTFELGFKGVGVLGAIWNAEDFLKSFLTIQNTVLAIG